MENAEKLSVRKISQLRKEGITPTTQSFYSPQMIELTRRIYKHDFALYADKCSPDALLFNID